MSFIALTGPSSYTSWILSRLLLHHGNEVRVLGRSSRPIMPLIEAGAQYVEGNLLTPSKLRALLEDARALYLVTPGSASAVDPYEVQIAHVVAGAVEASDVEHVVYLSALGAAQPGDVPHLQSKAEVEQILLDTGRDVTLLRPGIFMDNMWLARRALDRGLFAMPMHPDSTFPAIAARDVALAALACLTRPAEGCRGLDLPGPSRVSPRQIAEVLERSWDRVVTYYRYTEEEFLSHLTALGLSHRRAALVTSLLADYDRYEISADPAPWAALRQEAGIEETSLAQFARELVAGHGPPPNLRRAMTPAEPPRSSGGTRATDVESMLDRTFGTPEDLPTGRLPSDTPGTPLAWLRSAGAGAISERPMRWARAEVPEIYVSTPRSDEAGSGASGT